MKNIIITTAIVVFSITKISGQSSAKSKADLAWKSLPKFIYSGSENDKLEYEKAYEVYLRAYIEACLKFYNEFSSDKRQMAWIASTMGASEPRFWKDINVGARELSSSKNGFYSTPIDFKLLKEWKRKRNQIINIILNDTLISDAEKQMIRLSEVKLELSRSRNAIYRGDKKQFISRFKTHFETASINTKEENNEDVTRYGEQLILAMDNYGLNLNDIESLIKSLFAKKYTGIQKWVRQKKALMELRNEPFELKYYTIDGKKIDLANFRGKVVLVDFWATGCSDCIARMPAIKSAYDKYKANGFVVISAAYNPDIDKDKILSIHNRIGADWPLLMIGGDSDKSGIINPHSIGKQIWQKYGFTYVPQLLLLNKKGKLVRYNGVLLKGDFEPILRELLSE